MNRPQPNNLAEAQQVIDQLFAATQQLTDTVSDLQGQVAWLSKQLFGSKSERWADTPPAGLFAHLKDDEVDEAAASPPKQTVTYERESPRRGKRQPIPDHLPRIDRIHDLPEAEKAGMKRIGEEVSEQLEHEPGKVYVVRHVRYTYARKDQLIEPPADQPNVVTAPKPEEGLPRCIAGPSLLGQIMVSKFADHLPLHRLEGILKRSGVALARSSMCRWAQDLDAMCMPLLRLMKQRLLQSHVIQADETPVKQQHGPGTPGKRGKTKQCYFFSYVGDDEHPYIVYDYQASRSRAGPNGWFTHEKGQPNFHGYLQCDAYAGYNDLFDSDQPWRMTHVGCMAHVRRKYYDVRAQFPGPCHHALGQFKLLYEVEREAKELDAQKRQALRHEKSRPILESLLDWCEDQQKQGPGMLPKSGLGEAIGYTLNQADSLKHYLNDGQLAIDNNRCERSLRGIAIGRKNWLFTGSEPGGRAAATMFSLISSALRHDLEPWRYLTDVFRRLPSTPVSQLDQFLPDQWQDPNN